MFSLGVPELLIILVIVLLIFGAKRLPEIGRAFGKSVRELKDAAGGNKDEISTWIKDDEVKSKDSSEDEKDFIQNKVDDIPGVKEAKEIKETASKIKAASKFFLKK